MLKPEIRGRSKRGWLTRFLGKIKEKYDRIVHVADHEYSGARWFEMLCNPALSGETG